MEVSRHSHLMAWVVVDTVLAGLDQYRDKEVELVRHKWCCLKTNNEITINHDLALVWTLFNDFLHGGGFGNV